MWWEVDEMGSYWSLEEAKMLICRTSTTPKSCLSVTCLQVYPLSLLLHGDKVDCSQPLFISESYLASRFPGIPLGDAVPEKYKDPAVILDPFPDIRHGSPTSIMTGRVNTDYIKKLPFEKRMTRILNLPQLWHTGLNARAPHTHEMSRRSDCVRRGIYSVVFPHSHRLA